MVVLGAVVAVLGFVVVLGAVVVVLGAVVAVLGFVVVLGAVVVVLGAVVAVLGFVVVLGAVVLGAVVLGAVVVVLGFVVVVLGAVVVVLGAVVVVLSLLPVQPVNTEAETTRARAIAAALLNMFFTLLFMIDTPSNKKFRSGRHHMPFERGSLTIDTSATVIWGKQSAEV